MSESASVAPLNATAGPYKRSAKNYLLDRHFQLKYAGFLVGMTLMISLVLGIALWTTSSEVIAQTEQTVDEGKETVRLSQETVKRGQEVLVQSRRVSQVVSMNIAKEYKDDPELAKTFSEAAANDEAKLKEEQVRLENDAAYLRVRAQELAQRASTVERQQRNLLLGIASGLALLVVAIGMAGIVFTHKVAGPVFKMKRLLREVGEGKLVVREKLRKGDELHHFFATFEKMVQDLRAKQEAEIARLDVIIERLDDSQVTSRGTIEIEEDGLTLLRKLRKQMQDQLEA